MGKANNSCAHSEGGLTSHWWAVDLGVPLYVAGVLFTNRADEHGNLYTYSLNNVFMGTFYAPPLGRGALSDDARLTSDVCLSVCLSRTSGLSREQRGLGRLKLAQR